MGVDLFSGIFNLVDVTLALYIYDTAKAVIDFVKPIFHSLMIIWIAIWGYLAMMGQTNEPLKDGFFRILRLTFIIALGLTLGTYVGLVVDFLSKGPEEIASVITGAPSTSLGPTLDTLYIKVFQLTDACWDKAGILKGNFGMYFIGFAVMILGTGLLLTVAFFLISAKIMTAVLLGIGPIFIVMLLFKGTQRFFESWLSLLCNYGFILILTSSLGTLALSLANTFFAKVGYPDTTDLSMANLYAQGMANLEIILKLLAVLGMIVLLVLQIPSVAAALGGGIALATQGIISSGMNILRPSSIQRAGRGIKREVAPFQKGWNRGKEAYKKRFGAGGSISGY